MAKQEEKEEEEEEVDRISLLPDFLILEILSRLDDTQYAIITGTLSKRWQNLWPQLSNLCFTNYRPPDITQFYSSLERILLSQTTQLNMFKLHASCHMMTPVNRCIRIAMRRNVREVDFDTDYQYSFQAGYGLSSFVLPERFFTCSSFIRVRLCNCLFKRAGVISWKNLRTLRIERGEIDEDMLENILSGSPLLETLELNGFYDFERIDITNNKSVKNLRLSKFGADFKHCTQINAPHILSLAIKGNLMLDKFMLQNVSSLSNFELDSWKKRSFHPVDFQEKLEEQDINEELLKGHLLTLAHAKEVKLGELCLEILTRLKAKGFIAPSNLKVLGEIA